MSRRILAVGAHPDDVEFGCAPLLLKEARIGNQVKVLIVSKGEAGSAGTPEQRAGEAREAAALLGAGIAFLDLGGDCRMECSPQNAIAIAREIRSFQPDIVLAPHREQNQHPDHAVVGKLVMDAARLARYGGLEPLKGLAPHRIGHLYYYVITQGFGAPPDIVADVSEVHQEWEAAMQCHQTQMKTKSYVGLVNARARLMGASIGTEYAVGLWVNEPVRVNCLSDLTLSSRNY